MSTTKKYLGYHDERKLPLKKGDVVTLKADILIVDMGRGGYGDPVINTKRRKVRVHHLMPGSDAYLLHGQTVPAQNPQIVWVGRGRYWCMADINDIEEVEPASNEVAP